MTQTSLNKYYVYTHTHPKTNEIVYVGKGIHGRAWDITRSRTTNKDHQNWMISLSDNGYLPCDWVNIIDFRLSEASAFERESALIHRLGQPIFNRMCGDKQHQSKITNQDAVDIYILSYIGISRKELEGVYPISGSAISMISSGKQWKAVTNFIREQLDEN